MIEKTNLLATALRKAVSFQLYDDEYYTSRHTFTRSKTSTQLQGYWSEDQAYVNYRVEPTGNIVITHIVETYRGLQTRDYNYEVIIPKQLLSEG